MSNTSASGGYLVPDIPSNLLNDAEIQDILHNMIAGITGLSGDLVRPRWQPEEPNIPSEDKSWCAFGITVRGNPGNPYEVHYASSGLYPNGYSELRRHQDFTVMVTFYGSYSDKNCMLLSAGIFIEQNQEALIQSNIFPIGHGQSRNISELIKNKWVYRVDLEIEFRRQIVLDYPILNILSSRSDINNEHYSEQITSG